MSPINIMAVAWAVITVLFFVLLLIRRSYTKNEADWIPLTDDAKEESAIKAQTMIELKAKKLTVPIRALGTLSVVLLLVMLGFWLYKSLSTPPPM